MSLVRSCTCFQLLGYVNALMDGGKIKSHRPLYYKYFCKVIKYKHFDNKVNEDKSSQVELTSKHSTVIYK